MTSFSEFPQDVVATAKAAIAEADAKAERLGEPTDTIECIARAIMADRTARLALSGLTRRQGQCLQFIAQFQSEHGGMSPSYDEIAAHMGIASKSGIVRLIDELEDRRRITRLPNRSRAITIIATPAN